MDMQGLDIRAYELTQMVDSDLGFCHRRIFEGHRQVQKPIIGQTVPLIISLGLAQWYYQETLDNALEVREKGGAQSQLSGIAAMPRAFILVR